MNKTILVIDDDPSIVNLLKEDLEAEGYHVLEGYDGKAAFEVARTSKPDLIVMDVNMPIFSGLKALEELRGLQATKNIPVLFLTGDSENQVFPGGDARIGQLKKPIDLDSFNAIVKDFLNRYPVS